MRILIADDEGSIRLFLKKVLRKLEYEVIETCNGAEAWDTLQKEKIKIVITDWLFLPSAFLAGDIFNYFRLDSEHVGFYLP